MAFWIFNRLKKNTKIPFNLLKTPFKWNSKKKNWKKTLIKIYFPRKPKSQDKIPTKIYICTARNKGVRKLILELFTAPWMDGEGKGAIGTYHSERWMRGWERWQRWGGGKRPSTASWSQSSHGWGEEENVIFLFHPCLKPVTTKKIFLQSRHGNTKTRNGEHEQRRANGERRRSNARQNRFEGGIAGIGGSPEALLAPAPNFYNSYTPHASPDISPEVDTSGTTDAMGMEGASGTFSFHG